jgi:hypothetical protein
MKEKCRMSVLGQGPSTYNEFCGQCSHVVDTSALRRIRRREISHSDPLNDVTLGVMNTYASIGTANLVRLKSSCWSMWRWNLLGTLMYGWDISQERQERPWF